MKAMILAAGRGERMRELTELTPKPLLKVSGKALIDYALENLARAGFSDIVVNLAYRGEQIRRHCGNGEPWGVSIRYSDEGATALETAGGIKYALPLLGDQPFLVVNADVICDYPLARLRDVALGDAHLVMVANPPHHPGGDFGVEPGGLLSESGAERYTFSGIGVYHPRLFDSVQCGSALKLRPLLSEAMRRRAVGGEVFGGLWLDIGTPERLRELEGAVLLARQTGTNAVAAD